MQPATLAKFLNLAVVFSLTLMALAMIPFFAPYAKHHFFLRPSFIGYIFGAFPVGYILVSILTSFCNISHISSFTINVVIRVTTVVEIITLLLFGALPYWLTFEQTFESEFKNMMVFALCRFLCGCSVGLMDVMLLLLLVRLFPDTVSDVVGQWEAMAGLGILFGPPIGGALYEAGGFFLPFAVCSMLSGALVLVSGVLLFKSKSLKLLFEERDREYEKEENHRTVTSKNVKALLRGPPHLVLGPSLLSGFALSAYTMIESMAPLHMYDEFHIQPGIVGLIIGAASLLYAVVSIVLGKVVGRPHMLRRRPLVVTLGAFAMGVCLFLAAPSTSVLFDRPLLSEGVRKAVAVCGLTSLGLVMPPLTVVGPSMVITAAKGKGDRLVPAAGAIGNMVASLGAFLGPVLGSHLIEEHGFAHAFYYYGCTAVALGVVYFWIYLWDMRRGMDILRLSEMQAGGVEGEDDEEEEEDEQQPEEEQERDNDESMPIIQH